MQDGEDNPDPCPDPPREQNFAAVRISQQV